MKQTAIELGNKVREIEINQKKYAWLTFSLLVIFNLILIGGLVYLCVSIPKWYIYTIVAVVWTLCVAESVRVFIKSKHGFKYEIYEKCLFVKTIYSSFIIKFENVFMVETKKSIVEKFVNSNTNTIVLHVKDNVRNIVKLPFISEDLNLLKQTIMQKAIDNREK